ncbi:hypothetical protein [Pectobacterium sp. A5351]|uniref:hypothetical protein n=1 Tax=Pectobacterium sp. A5351 TaxID=2914983 RepID=UPI00232D9AE2|nr:hypothetical protein [Pectobacterium sp. A5351]WCG83080.1 hypothetical protein O1Q74_19820 [Pectobacterium sp. A5351]
MNDGCYVATANAGGEKSPSEDGLKRFHGNKNKLLSILLFIGHGWVSAHPTMLSLLNAVVIKRCRY